MEFKRARSKEQKEERKNQIKREATKILTNKGFDDITFVKIAEDLSIKRPLIYTYYKNVADILIDALGDKWVYITKVLNEADKSGGIYSGLDIVLDIILNDDEIINLVLIYNTVLEPACSTESLLDYEFRYKNMHDEIKHFLSVSHPTMDDEEFRNKSILFWSLLLGMLNVSCRSEKQRVATEAVGSKVAYIDIKKEVISIINKLDE